MWIARDDFKRSDFTKKTKAGDLYLFVNKPVLLSQYGMRFWAVDENEMEDLDGCVQLDPELFPEVTFENSPVKVELKIKDNNESKQDRQKESIR